MLEVGVVVDIHQCHVGLDNDLCGLFNVLRRSHTLRWQSVVVV